MTFAFTQDVPIDATFYHASPRASARSSERAHHAPGDRTSRGWASVHRHLGVRGGLRAFHRGPTAPGRARSLSEIFGDNLPPEPEGLRSRSCTTGIPEPDVTTASNGSR